MFRRPQCGRCLCNLKPFSWANANDLRRPERPVYSSVELIGSTAIYSCLQVSFHLVRFSSHLPPNHFQFFHFMLPLAKPSSILSPGFHTEQWVSSAELHSPRLAGRRPPLPRFSSTPSPSFSLSFQRATAFGKAGRKPANYHLNTSCSESNKSYFWIEVVGAETSLLQGPPIVWSALNHCQSPTVFRTE